MKREISTLVQFIVDKLIGDRLPDSLRQKLRSSLSDLLHDRYDKHWYVEDPLVGHGYRVVQRCDGRLDPVLLRAFEDAGLGQAQLMKSTLGIPEDFSVWCDPEEVTVRIGAEGSCWPLDLVPGKYTSGSLVKWPGVRHRGTTEILKFLAHPCSYIQPLGFHLTLTSHLFTCAILRLW